jgi:hypothetical protein
MCFIKTLRASQSSCIPQVLASAERRIKAGNPGGGSAVTLASVTMRDQTAVTRNEIFPSHSDPHANWPVLGTIPWARRHVSPSFQSLYRTLSDALAEETQTAVHV